MLFLINNNTIRFILLCVLLFLCWYLGKSYEVDFLSYKTFLLKFPLFLSGFIFVVLYVGITFFAWLTKDLFKILGAVIFGAYISTLFIWIAESINAIVLFYLSRRLGREFVEKRLKGRLTGLDQNIEERGFFGLLVLRIVPLIPFRFLDLAAGLTKISFKKYFMIVLLGSPLRIFWIQFILAGVGERILEKPDIASLIPTLADYISKNNFIFLLSFAYLVAVIVIAVRLKKRI